MCTRICFALVACCATWLSATALSAAPNVLFIAVDDLNDWIGVLGGHPQSMTPNIDRLAKRGVLFTNAHCAAPACNPSRVALMTGIRPSTSGVYHNSQPWRPAMPNAVTLPQHFMQHGYTALGSGKIYHGAFPDPPSWDEYYPSKMRQKPDDPKPANRPVNGIPKTAHFDWGPVDVPDAEMGDAKVADWVIDQLGRQRDKPFFLACGFYRPHLPWYVPQAYFDQHPVENVLLPKVREDDLRDIPHAGIKMARPQGDHAKVVRHDQWKLAVQGYLASIAFVDQQIGRVLDAYDAAGRGKDTIIVFWTDHGWHLGEKEHWRKFALWERATRTPVAIYAPGVTKPGDWCDHAVSLIDLYPTLIELCGLPERDELEGRSIAALLRTPTAKGNGAVVTTHGRNNHAVRDRGARYIRYADGSQELYFHRNDPHEWNNVAAEERYAKVITRMSKWLPTVNVPDAPHRRNR